MKRGLAFCLVVVQVLLLIGLVFLPHGTLWPVNAFVATASFVFMLVGVILFLLGAVRLGPALRASPIPKEDSALVTTGVYGYIRNPIYAGFIVGGFGLTLFSASFLHVFLLIALAFLLSAKARWEERMLIVEHPEYGAYAARVGRFFPGIGRLRPPG